MLAGLAAKAADRRLAPGEWLAREGERLAFFVILRGSLELTKEIEGRAIHISDYNSGDFFGEVNTLFGIPALSSLRARTTCRIAAFELQQLQGMLQSRTKCGDIILESLRKGLERGPRHAMGLPAVRVRIGGQQNDPSLTRCSRFLNQIGSTTRQSRKRQQCMSPIPIREPYLRGS